MKKTLPFAFICLFLTSCAWFKSEPEIATVLAKHFDNKLYKQFDTLAYHAVFEQKLAAIAKDLSYPRTITAYYQQQQNKPSLVTQFYVNGQIDSLKHYIERSNEDGFNPQTFELRQLTASLKSLDSNHFKSIEQVYPAIADLELHTAQALLRYVNFMHYGSVNPGAIFNRYHIPNERPDSLSMTQLLNSTDILTELKNAQPLSKDYRDLKRELAVYRDSLKTDDHPIIKVIKVNLERLRWRVPITSEEKVVINIPDFSLIWFNKEDTLTKMNVCVGAKREEAYIEKMKQYRKSKKLDDMPKNYETPQLLSVFNSIQVNPIWNIPVSIAQGEIYYQALKDPYYLSNNNIKVYYKGKVVNDPDTINWSKYSRDKLPFQFKQGAGEGNALGKFKFVFENGSSIYLHDTNNKYGFKLKNRAISHGCIRVEDPLKFAQLMVKDESQYDRLRMEVSLPPIDTNRNVQYKKILAKKADTIKPFKLKPAWFASRKNITVLISYYTASVERGKLRLSNDVYGYDDQLWEALKKYI